MANKRLSPQEEQKRITEAAQVIPILNPDVLALQEVRDWDSCQKLADAIKALSGASQPPAPLEYHVAICSAFKEGNSVGWQQVAILCKTPAQAAWASEWTTSGVVDPPRGYAFAVLHFGGRDIGLYPVHLKSNLVRGGDQEKQRQLNILKRELSAEQLVAHTMEVVKPFPKGIAGFVVVGDLNTNRG